MKKQIILTTAIVFVAMYLFHGFVELEFDFRCWTNHYRLGYLYISTTLTVGFLVIAYINSKIY